MSLSFGIHLQKINSIRLHLRLILATYQSQFQRGIESYESWNEDKSVKYKNIPPEKKKGDEGHDMEENSD